MTYAVRFSETVLGANHSNFKDRQKCLIGWMKEYQNAAKLLNIDIGFTSDTCPIIVFLEDETDTTRDGR